jgi:hypothetical protein
MMCIEVLRDSPYLSGSYGPFRYKSTECPCALLLICRVLGAWADFMTSTVEHISVNVGKETNCCREVCVAIVLPFTSFGGTLKALIVWIFHRPCGKNRHAANYNCSGLLVTKRELRDPESLARIRSCISQNSFTSSPHSLNRGQQQ